uniref:UTP3 small subunit processome component n=1 Tax=Lepisosteus oculatus TaxID=7918 RepID=W5LZV8_LEPOC
MAHGVQEDSDQEDIADEELYEDQVLGNSCSDLEGRKEEGLPNEMAWGLRKKLYYDTDYVTTKGKPQEELEAEEEEEEEEAKNIQKRLMENLREEDYDLHLLQEFATEQEEAKAPEKEGKIVKDLAKMSQKEKLKLLKKESPELLELIQDFKAKLAELKDEVQPLVQMVKDGKIPEGKGAEYLRTKQQLYLNYCTNISFYLVLKAKRIPAHNHPVIERLVTFRNLINDLGPVDARVSSELRLLLSETEKGRTVSKPSENKQPTGISKKGPRRAQLQPAGDSGSDMDEQEALRFYRQMEERLKLKRKKQTEDSEEGPVPEEEEELDAEAKRAITYQMAKNKGLTPKRKKIDRNPRVKHREKFRRAKIRRRGQVREVRREEQRYGGELSGIRAGVKKSVKLK